MPPFGSIAAALKRSSKQSSNAATSAENPARRFNTEDISVQLQRVLSPLQIESLSLHNALGDLVWRNDGVFGDDEQAIVLDALDMFAIDETREDLRLKLDDDRSALFACARDATRVMRGVALVIVETPASESELTAKLSGPSLQTQIRRFAQLLAPAPAANAAPAPPPAATPKRAQSTQPAEILGTATTTEAVAPLARVMDSTSETLLVSRDQLAGEEFTVAPDPTAYVVRAPQAALEPPAAWAENDTPTVESSPLPEVQVSDFGQAGDLGQAGDISQALELEADDVTQITPVALRPLPPAPRPALPAAVPPVAVERRTKATPAADEQSGSIRARRYTRLRTGGAARRYEVKPSSIASSRGDLALTALVTAHLQRSLDRYTQAPSTFTIPLSSESVTQNGWVSKVNNLLKRTGVPRGMVGFSLSPAIWQDEAAATERFIADCEAVGCFVALDDFSLQQTGLALLRSAAVQCLKLDPRLIAAVTGDRFAHAQLAAIVHAARVLGHYCVAKQVTTTSQAKWLASAGIEFADGVGRGVLVAATTRRGPAHESTEM